MPIINYLGKKLRTILTNKISMQFKIFFPISLLVSLAAKTKVKVKFDGEDWIHKFNDKYIAYYKPTAYVVKMSGRHVPFFTSGYKPKTGGVVFDIGAGIGTEIYDFSQMVGSTGTVIAVEADPIAFRRLSKLVDFYNFKNVQIINCAVGDKKIQNVILSQGSPEGQENHVVQQSSKLNENLKSKYTIVSQVTITDLCITFNINHIDYLKMNIEGSEVRALYGLTGSKLLPRHVCICCHDFLGTDEMTTYNKVNEWLYENNYKTKEMNLDSLRPSELYTIFAERLN